MVYNGTFVSNLLTIDMESNNFVKLVPIDVHCDKKHCEKIMFRDAALNHRWKRYIAPAYT